MLCGEATINLIPPKKGGEGGGGGEGQGQTLAKQRRARRGLLYLTYIEEINTLTGVTVS